MYVTYDNDNIHFEQSFLYLDIQDNYCSTHVFHLEIQRQQVFDCFNFVGLVLEGKQRDDLTNYLTTVLQWSSSIISKSNEVTVS